MEATKIVTMAFLRPGADDNYVSHLTAKISRHPICHVELVFEECHHAHQSFSIYHDHPVGFRLRTLSNPHYETVSLAVSPAEYSACYKFCLDAHQRQYTFDSFGMYIAMFRPPCIHRTSAAVGKTFCSKIITEALQAAQLHEVLHLTPACTTPSRLYEAVHRSPKIVCNPIRSRLANLQIHM